MENEFPYHTSFIVRIGDINYGGHVGNDKLLLVFHDARLRYLKSLGYSEMDIGNGAGLIMIEAHIFFKGEIFLGDELLVGVRIGDRGKIKLSFEFLVQRESDGKVVATASTLMAAFDYDQRRVCKIPEEFLKAVTR